MTQFEFETEMMKNNSAKTAEIAPPQTEDR